MLVHLRLRSSQLAPGSARRRVRRAVTDAGHADLADTAEVLTSELVTNAVAHTGSDSVDVSVETDGVVRVTVSDASHDAALPREASPEETSGRGLSMVAALAARWGIEFHRDDGKSVWFELAGDERLARTADIVRTTGRAAATVLHAGQQEIRRDGAALLTRSQQLRRAAARRRSSSADD